MEIREILLLSYLRHKAVVVFTCICRVTWTFLTEWECLWVHSSIWTKSRVNRIWNHLLLQKHPARWQKATRSGHIFCWPLWPIGTWRPARKALWSAYCSWASFQSTATSRSFEMNCKFEDIHVEFRFIVKLKLTFALKLERKLRLKHNFNFKFVIEFK